MYGTLNGFANLTRDFTDIIFSLDSEYIAEIYKEFHGQLFGNNPILRTEQKDEEKRIVANITKYIEQPKSEEKTETTTKEIENNIEADYREKLKPVKIKSQIIIDTIIEICKKFNFSNSDSMFTAISKINGVGEKTIEKIKNALSPNQQIVVQQQAPMIGFFDSSGNFLSDFDFLSSHSGFISIVSKHKDWKKDLKWFIDEYNNPDSQYYKGKSRENKEVIKKFIFLKKEKYKETEAFLLKLYS